MSKFVQWNRVLALLLGAAACGPSGVADSGDGSGSTATSSPMSSGVDSSDTSENSSATTSVDAGTANDTTSTGVQGSSGTTSTGGVLRPCDALLTFEGSAWVSDVDDVEMLAGYECIDGSLWIDVTVGSLAGLESIQIVTGSVTVSTRVQPLPPGSLPDFVGLNGLEQIGGDFTVGGTELLTFQGLDQLSTIGGNVRWYENPALSTLEGLGALQQIEGDLEFGWYPDQGAIGLVDVSSLSSLSRVGGQVLRIYGTGLPDLVGFQSLVDFDGALYIVGNPMLTSITALSGLTQLQELAIGNNTSLPDCDAFAFADGVTVSGDVSIGGNLEDACSP